MASGQGGSMDGAERRRPARYYGARLLEVAKDGDILSGILQTVIGGRVRGHAVNKAGAACSIPAGGKEGASSTFLGMLGHRPCVAEN